MKFYSDMSEQKFLSGMQPHKSLDKHRGKNKRLHSFKRDDAGMDELDRSRAGYKRAATKNLLRNQLWENLVH
ncbi:hypothetical protein [Cellvibrio sp.]|uniref:hypothetical protein n=1 Tax=Cellvibrio sp. TaxID=1965322 RepID=UPI0039647C8C